MLITTSIMIAKHVHKVDLIVQHRATTRGSYILNLSITCAREAKRRHRRSTPAERKLCKSSQRNPLSNINDAGKAVGCSLLGDKIIVVRVIFPLDFITSSTPVPLTEFLLLCLSARLTKISSLPQQLATALRAQIPECKKLPSNRL